MKLLSFTNLLQTQSISSGHNTMRSLRVDPLPLVLLVVVVCCCSWVAPVSGQAPGTPIEYHTEEELPAGSMVGNITRSAGITDLTQLQEMQFSLADQRDSKWDLFTVDAAGILRTTDTIDRDKICAQEDVCAVNLRVIVQPIKYFRVIKVTVHIDDRNDNPPTFPRSMLQISVAETTPPDTGFSLPSAEDLDSTANGVLEYKLNPEDGAFSLLVQDTADGEVALQLVLQRKLDREREESYTMWVTALDRGQPQLTGSMLVQVKVLDANDNNPKFDNASYRVMVPENIPVGTTILQVTATDGDIGVNGEIYYGFPDATAVLYGEVFEVNPQTGELSVIGEIDYESFNLYQLTIVARDRGENSLPAYAKVDVVVEDLNDHAPLIEVNALTPTGDAQVSEGKPVGLFVAFVKVSDPDGGEIRCNLDSDLFGLEEVSNMESYQLVTKVIFDRETKSDYHINLVCQDRGQPPLTSTKYIPITVTDENDHSPVFTQSEYRHVMSENNELGYTILQLSITDQDLGRNAAVIFEVHGANDQVVVDRITGVVTANKVFDYEQTKLHEYLVVAVDQGETPHTATATLIIEVQDQNDNPPSFSKQHYVFTTQENIAADLANIEVGQVVATDADGEPYNKVLYSLQNTHGNGSSNFMEMFSIDPHGGMILLKQKLDRETQEFYYFNVKAENDGYPDVFSLANVEIHVADTNDNPPFIYVNTFNYTLDGNDTIRLSGKLPKGLVVATIGATDADTGTNAAVSYTLVNISNNLFRLDTGTGDITLNADLGDNPVSVTHIVVEVSDKGTPKMSTTTELKIIVNRSLVALTPPITGHVESFWNAKSYFAIGIAATCLLIIILAVISVTVVKRKRKVKDKRHTYNCRLEAEKSTTHCNGTGATTPGRGDDHGKHNHSFEGDLKEPERVTVQGVELGESCTDEGWPKAQENPYVLDQTVKSDHNNKRDSGIEMKMDIGAKSLDPESSNNQRHMVPPQQHPPTYARLPLQHTPIKEMELQVQDMLHMLLREKESPSETGSYTDSGKGPSEEGDHSHSWPDCHMDTARGLPTVVEAHALALTDNPHRHRQESGSGSYGATPEGTTNPYAGCDAGFSDDGIYVEAIPREQVYAQDPSRRAYDAKYYNKGGQRERLAPPIPSYTPPPSYHDSVAAGPKRLVRFASYNHQTPSSGEQENYLAAAIPRTLSDSASWSADRSREPEDLYASVFRSGSGAPRRQRGEQQGQGGHPQVLEENPYSNYALQRVTSQEDNSNVYDRLANSSCEQDSGSADLYTSLYTQPTEPSSRGGNSKKDKSRNNRLQRTKAERLGETSAKSKKPKVQFWDEGPIDKCVHDVVARYIPDRTDSSNCPESIEAFSDDDATTESGSYVVDSHDILRERASTAQAERMFVDYIVV